MALEIQRLWKIKAKIMNWLVDHNQMERQFLNSNERF